jgi:hypothetical protein
MFRRLALLAAVPLSMLAVAGTAAAAPASSPQPAAPAPATAPGITLCHEGFEIQLAPVRAVVVLIGANDYGLVARRAC